MSSVVLRQPASMPWASAMWGLFPRTIVSQLSSTINALPFPSSITLRLPLPTDLGLGLGKNPFGIVLAAPKKKVSLRRRHIRWSQNGNKKIKPVESLTECPGCGRVKRAHTVCTPCHEEIRKVWTAERGGFSKPESEIPESIDKEFLELTEKQHSSIPSTRKFLYELMKEEQKKDRLPMFPFETLRKNRRLK
ncbi:mitochondrial 54S ribosomal protein bL32m [Lipomyces oligophaga]|uniref:mitochondrial 54S ribosomal protein bL32m n=1 Tax=Lipomyces oligophaga TaxID=45792 RepID=UPI0034CF4F80